MKCPTCDYELDRFDHARCPRCGSPLNCSVLDCGSCDACGGTFTGLGRWLLGGREDE